MKKMKFNPKIITALSIASLILIFSTNFVIAQARIPLVVAPARQSVAIDPGKSENLQIKFFNESTSPITGNLKAVDFVVTGSDGSPLLLEDQLDDWVKLPYDKAAIPSGDVLKINFKVEVPATAVPGGRYVAIVFEQTGQIDQTPESASAVSSRLVGLVNIRVNGPIIESAFINQFKTPKFLEFGKIPVSFEILNKGGYHINPKGQVTLTNWMGKEIERVTLDDKNIFPNAKRIYDTKIGETWMFGKYKVGIEASYGDTGKTLIANNYVWVIPVTVIAIVIFTILIAILAAYVISKKFTAKQEVLEEKLEQEISEIEALKSRFKDKLPK